MGHGGGFRSAYYIGVPAPQRPIPWAFGLLTAVVGLGVCPACVVRQPPASTATQPPSGLLPARQVWLASLPASPSADAAADAQRIYVPLHSDETDELVALDRETGDILWRSPAATRWPPVASGTSLLVAVADGLRQLDSETGATTRHIALPAALSAPILPDGARVLVSLVSGAVTSILDGGVEWATDVGSPPRALSSAGGTIVAALADARVVALAIDTGRVLWRTDPLAGTLTRPTISTERVIVGSTDNTLFALDASTGRLAWPPLATGGAVVGTASDGNLVYITSLDNVVRAVSAGSGNQRWKHVITTRALTPPQLHRGAVLIHGNQPLLTALDAGTGEERGTFQLPEELGAPLVQGSPIILPPSEPPSPTAAVIVMRTGTVLGIGPAAAPAETSPATPSVKSPLTPAAADR
jgi:outer membrane protein assembly factor BamB